MPLICYQNKRFDPSTLRVIEQANEILDSYAAQGYDLTLRQLYYQFVARALIVNKDTEYKRLGSIVNDARLAGLIDWARITDRTRNLRKNSHWESPQDIVRSCVDQYQIDKWGPQSHYVEVWVEKDALVGVLEVACNPLDVPYFSCRGYTSQSEVWGAGQRLLAKMRDGKKVVVIHLGDHDPSGIDMSRDILDRLTMFLRHHTIMDFAKKRPIPKREDRTEEWAKAESEAMLHETAYGSPVIVKRIALNMDQVEQYNPPPNPAKLTDSRFKGYNQKYGDESWELDALEPATIARLIRGTVFEFQDLPLWEESEKREESARKDLKQIATNWDAAMNAAKEQS